MSLKCNGYIIQKTKEGPYKGVEGDNWFLNYEDDVDKDIVGYFDKYIDLAWSDDERVDVCNDFAYINTYLDVAINKNINFRVILCYTPRVNPEMNDLDLTATFLGYDYAYSGGSYYSAVANDVVSQRILYFTKFKLNSHGLFESQEEILEFITTRIRYMESSPEYDFDDGDFIIYKLYELNIKKCKHFDNVKEKL